MNTRVKYFSCGLLAFIMILGWNAFLIKRDDALYKSYYKRQAVENIKKSMLNN